MTEIRGYAVRLRNEKLQNANGMETDLLFPDPEPGNRKPYSQRKIQTTVKKVCKLAGLRVRNPHDLLHTYATILLMAHQSPAYLRKQLGHSSIKTTVDICGHWISGEGRGGLDEAPGGKIERKRDAECTLYAPWKKQKPQSIKIAANFALWCRRGDLNSHEETLTRP